jgi:molecular chaperone DnaJ
MLSPRRPSAQQQRQLSSAQASFFAGSSLKPAAAQQRRRQLGQERCSGVVVRAERDFYKILGVSRDSDKKTIKTAYRQLARKFHPVSGLAAVFARGGRPLPTCP